MARQKKVSPHIVTEGITVVDRRTGREARIGGQPDSDGFGVVLVGENGRAQASLVLVEGGAVLSFAYGPQDCLVIGMGDAPVHDPCGYVEWLDRKGKRRAEVTGFADGSVRVIGLRTGAAPAKKK